jgi:chromosomal replication initiation ATPase DnaA
MDKNSSESIRVKDLPAVASIIETAQGILRNITGLRIKLEVVVVEDNINQNDLLWFFLKKSISEVVNVPWEEIEAGGRKGKKGMLSLYRKLYCYVGKIHVGGRTFSQIGDDVGMKNHTSAMVALDDFKELITDPLRTDHEYALRIYNDVLNRITLRQGL